MARPGNTWRPGEPFGREKAAGQHSRPSVPVDHGHLPLVVAPGERMLEEGDEVSQGRDPGFRDPPRPGAEEDRRGRVLEKLPVVGLPDERFGEAITALVEASTGATIDEASLIAHVKSTLAAYKAPKRVFLIETIGRAANGKLDYKQLKAQATELSD